MKFKRFLAAALSTCMLLSAVPVFAAPAAPAAVPAAASASAEEDVVLIPEDLIGAMEEDVDRKDWFRLPSFRETAAYLREMPRLYNVINTRARTLSSSRDLAALDAASSLNGKGPMGVVPALLNGEPVTLLVLGGTFPAKGQATGFKEDVLSAMEQSNDYLRNIVKLFDAKNADGSPVIPADKPVIVSGLSLGGMVAQQLLAQKDLMDRFDIHSIICFGAPLLAAEYRTPDTRVVRICDSADQVPYAGRPHLQDMLAQKLFNKQPSELIRQLDQQEVIRRDGGYRTTMMAHSQSYIMNPCWKDLDVLGQVNGTNELVMQGNLQFYPCPRLGR